MSEVEPCEITKKSSPGSQWRSPAYDSYPATDATTLRFNVLRRLPNLNLMHKWCQGDVIVTPLPCSAARENGHYDVVPVGVPDDLTATEQLFVELVAENGVDVVADSRSEALIPGLHGWPMRASKINNITWEVQE